ncbi:hypothetical protein LEO78_00750 [Aeromonas hydrophila]|nr:MULTISPECIES: hypothetical protein [Aeromonas]UCM63852.1 hypothetical protein LEO78_00750 [Aeromonas hydrophila]
MSGRDSAATKVSRPTQYDRFSQNEVQQSRVQIQFDDVGVKWLVTEYARLEAL